MNKTLSLIFSFFLISSTTSLFAMDDFIVAVAKKENSEKKELTQKNFDVAMDKIEKALLTGNYIVEKMRPSLIRLVGTTLTMSEWLVKVEEAFDKIDMLPNGAPNALLLKAMWALPRS